MAPPRAPMPPRLQRRSQFLAVARGRKAATPGLVLQALPQATPGPARLGFTATRKIGNAVIRNRTRRRLREAARLLLAEMPVSGVDLVLVGRAATHRRRFADLMEDLRRALTETGVRPADARPAHPDPVSA